MWQVMDITPAKQIVICEQPENKTAGGLTLNIGGDDDKKDKPPELGLVIKIGAGKKPIEFKVGDTIVYRRYMDNRIEIGGREYNFIGFTDIIGVLSKS